MSDTDSFIEEVTEEVRRERLFQLIRRYGWIAVLAVVLIVGGAAWNEWQKAKATAEAQAFGDAVLAALGQEPGAARGEALAAITGPGERGAVAGFLLAADEIAGEDRAAAVAQLAEIAADATLPVSYRDLARLKHLLLAGGDLPEADRRAVLDELAQPGRPYRVLAQEQQALMMLDSGDRDGAVALLEALEQDDEATAGLRRRVTQLIVTLQEEPAAE